MVRYVGAGQYIEHLQSCPTNGGVVNTPLPNKLLSFAFPGSKNKTEGVKCGRSTALIPGKLDLSYKADKCNDAGTGEFGELPTHEIS